MTESLRESIERIRELAPVLNKATDDAQAIVARLEQFLSEYRVGVPAKVKVDDMDVSKNISRQRYLSYERVDGKFRIAVTTHLACETDEVNHKNNINEPFVIKFMPDPENPPIAWCSCPRDVKLVSFDALPELLRKIAKEAFCTSQQANNTVETVRQILTAVAGE